MAEKPFYDGSSSLYSESEIIDRVSCDADTVLLGGLSPARSGSTALLALLTSQEWVVKGYFQPLKTILRWGEPLVTISEDIAAFKEVFGVTCKGEIEWDPIRILVSAGAKKENLRLIMTLRDPITGYASWRSLDQVGEMVSPRLYELAMRQTLSLYERWKDEVPMVPLPYEFLAHGEVKVLNRVLTLLHLPWIDSLDFKDPKDKLVLGEAQKPAYRRRVLDPVLNSSRFEYRTNRKKISRCSSSELKEVRQRCGGLYWQFVREAKENVFGGWVNADSLKKPLVLPLV